MFQLFMTDALLRWATPQKCQGIDEKYYHYKSVHINQISYCRRTWYSGCIGFLQISKKEIMLISKLERTLLWTARCKYMSAAYVLLRLYTYDR